MAWEPISPELALVDPDLGARARAALADPAPATYAPRPTPSPTEPRDGSIVRIRSGRASPRRCGCSYSASLSAAQRSRTRRTLHASFRRARTHASAECPARRRPRRRSPAARRERQGAANAPLAAGRPSEPRLQSGAPGAIAQLGERLDRTQEVASSSLASSISKTAGKRRSSVGSSRPVGTFVLPACYQRLESGGRRSSPVLALRLCTLEEPQDPATAGVLT